MYGISIIDPHHDTATPLLSYQFISATKIGRTYIIRACAKGTISLYPLEIGYFIEREMVTALVTMTLLGFGIVAYLTLEAV